ncbi:class I SAM-dependent methyltransferase [Eubacterium xylanophilum]|uniref:class I SAM-dependent methyltransferase n=1 Tax=Eubacterium xylanophilum TaxID=39497 RepID=UPI000478B8E1|nr:SAM-dependent methyltransferase [Eubacterium xylanophilum]
MNDLQKILDAELGETLQKIIISNPKAKGSVSKVVVRPFLQKDEVCFQAESFKNNQAFHKNYSKEDVMKYVMKLMVDDFKQCEIFAEQNIYRVLVSKKGKVNIKKKVNSEAGLSTKYTMTHNRQKKYILDATENVIPFLVDLGVQAQDGKIIDKKYKKYKQINRFLEYIRDVLPYLDKSREITIVDFGCGKSYLTFAIYYYLTVQNDFKVNMVGLDLKEDVIEHCNKLAEQYGYDKLKFYVGDIADFEGKKRVDMVITLHACDTATDYALEKAVKWSAKVILSVPCCQHELNKQIKAEELSPILKHGILKERFAALATDAIRAEILESKGYDTDILEFIDMAHTPKNLLIRAVKKGKDKGEIDAKTSNMCDMLNAHLTLEKLLG